MMGKKTINLGEFAKNLKKFNSIALFCHVRPDGDTMGSAFALKKALEKLGKTVEVFCDDSFPEKYNFLGLRFSTNYSGNFDALVAVDCAELTRMGNYAFKFSGKNTFNIDHHISNTRYAEYNYISEKASNAENIFDLITELDIELDNEIANLILLGIVTDTGGFAHKNVTDSTLSTASKLLGFGADLNYIMYNSIKAQTKNRADLFAFVMSKLRFFFDGQLGIATVMKKDIEKFQAKSGDTEGFIDFVMNIDTVKVGICLMQVTERSFKASFRSKGVDVNEIATLFGGGGHKLASGCQISGEYEEIVDKLRFAVGQRL